MNEPSYPELHAAIRWAAKQHQGQDRDGSNPLPYITHPLDVLAKLRWIGEVVHEPQLCAAVLHDVLEETAARPKDIRDRFGSEVTKLVQELTRKEPTSKDVEDLTETQVVELRSNWLLEGVRRMSPEAMAVKLADRLSNLEDSQRTRSGDRLNRYCRQTDGILAAIPREVNPALWDAVSNLRNSIERQVRA